MPDEVPVPIVLRQEIGGETKNQLSGRAEVNTRYQAEPMSRKARREDRDAHDHWTGQTQRIGCPLDDLTAGKLIWAGQIVHGAMSEVDCAGSHKGDNHIVNCNRLHS